MSDILTDFKQLKQDPNTIIPRLNTKIKGNTPNKKQLLKLVNNKIVDEIMSELSDSLLEEFLLLIYRIVPLKNIKTKKLFNNDLILQNMFMNIKKQGFDRNIKEFIVEYYWINNRKNIGFNAKNISVANTISNDGFVFFNSDYLKLFSYDSNNTVYKIKYESIESIKINNSIIIILINGGNTIEIEINCKYEGWEQRLANSLSEHKEVVIETNDNKIIENNIVNNISKNNSNNSSDLNYGNNKDSKSTGNSSGNTLSHSIGNMSDHSSNDKSTEETIFSPKKSKIRDYTPFEDLCLDYKNKKEDVANNIKLEIRTNCSMTSNNTISNTTLESINSKIKSQASGTSTLNTNVSSIDTLNSTKNPATIIINQERKKMLKLKMELLDRIKQKIIKHENRKFNKMIREIRKFELM